MSIRRGLLPALSVALFAGASWVAEAQTGPIGGGAQDGRQAGDAKNQTAERVAALHKSKVEKLTNGDKSVRVVIEKDGWKYDMNIVFRGNANVFDVRSALSAPNQTFTAEQIKGMEQKNQEWKEEQKYFEVNKDDKRLYLSDVNFKVECSEQQFAQILDRYMNTVRSTYELWKAVN
jgi:hypothetical protein